MSWPWCFHRIRCGGHGWRKISAVGSYPSAGWSTAAPEPRRSSGTAERPVRYPGRHQEPGLHGWKVTAFYVWLIKVSKFILSLSCLTNQSFLFSSHSNFSPILVLFWISLATTWSLPQRGYIRVEFFLRPLCIPGGVVQTVYGLWRGAAVYSHLSIQNDWKRLLRNWGERQKPQRSCCCWPFSRKSSACVQASVTGYKV